MIVNTREFWQSGIVAVMHLLSSIDALDIFCILKQNKHSLLLDDVIES